MAVFFKPGHSSQYFIKSDRIPLTVPLLISGLHDLRITGSSWWAHQPFAPCLSLIGIFKAPLNLTLF